MYTGGTKKGEIDRTLEYGLEILEREGVNNRGMFYLISFLRDSGRSLDDYLQVAAERAKK